MLFIAKKYWRNYLKRKLRFLHIFLVAALFLASSLLTINYTANSITKPSVAKYYIFINQVIITDTLTGGEDDYILAIGCNWIRIFVFYGDAFDEDDEYEDNLRGNSDPPDDWVIYGEPLDGGQIKTYETNANTETSYTAEIDYSGTEIVLWLAIKKWYTPYRWAYYEIPETSTGVHYDSLEFDFTYYFGGKIKVQYSIVAA